MLRRESQKRKQRNNQCAAETADRRLGERRDQNEAADPRFEPASGIDGNQTAERRAQKHRIVEMTREVRDDVESALMRFPATSRFVRIRVDSSWPRR